METLKVELGDRSYEIVIMRGLLGHAGKLLKELNLTPKCLLVTNATVDGIYGDVVRRSLSSEGFLVRTAVVEDSEKAKSLTDAEKLYQEAYDFGIDRRSPFIALGGGVVGDLTGFVAATYMRGVPFIQIPTTLLAQVDSSVGGKVAINYLGIKNLIGAFYQPSVVIIDPSTLDSLPAREFKSGLAEVIKYGIIWDKGFFNFLERHGEEILSLEPTAVESIIYRSCKIKAEVVSCDERERDLRMILNLGHTFGHAVEVIGGFRVFKHGEAVGIGTCLAARLAKKMGILHGRDADRIICLVERFGLPTALPQKVAPETILEIMRKDKKNREAKITLILPIGIGRVQKYRFAPEEILPLLRELFV